MIIIILCDNIIKGFIRNYIMIKYDDFRKEYLLKEIEFKKQILNNYGNYEKGIDEGIKKYFYI